jgi:hypothetical protein
MTTARKAEFPDRVLSPVELRRLANGLPLATRTYFFDESWQRTTRVSVEAADAGEAWTLYHAGRVRVVSDLDPDECVDAVMLAPGDADYPVEGEA